MMSERFENVSRLSLLNSAHLVHSSVFLEFFGNEMTKSLIRDGVLKPIEWLQLEGTSLCLPLDGIEKNFWINLKNDKIVFEPVDGVGEPLEKPLGFEKFVSIEKGALARRLFQENSFSFESSESTDGNTFWGTKVISQKKIIWCVSFSKTNLMIPVLKDALQRMTGQLCLFTSVFSSVSSTEVSIIHVPLPDIKKYWTISPLLYLKNEFGFRPSDYLALFPSHPLLVDRVEKIAYLFGQKMNNKADDRVFKFIEALITYAQASELTHDYFASRCIGTNETPQDHIRDMRRIIKERVEKIISDSSQKTRALIGLYEQPRNGYVKCGFSPEEILIWS